MLKRLIRVKLQFLKHFSCVSKSNYSYCISILGYQNWIELLLIDSNNNKNIYAGHCRRSRDELISDVLLWTPTYGWTKAGRPAWTYIQQLCEDTGCSPEHLPEVMNDREKWRERVRDIRATSMTWWWWCVETIAILVCKQIISHSYKMKTLTNYSLTNHMYIHWKVCKQTTNVKLLQLHSNTWNCSTVLKNEFWVV